MAGRATGRSDRLGRSTEFPPPNARGVYPLRRLVLFPFLASIGRCVLDIPGYDEVRITTGSLEGLNNKIETVKRRAYGSFNMNHFKLKILALSRTKHAFVV